MLYLVVGVRITKHVSSETTIYMYNLGCGRPQEPIQAFVFSLASLFLYFVCFSFTLSIGRSNYGLIFPSDSRLVPTNLRPFLFVA